MKLLIARLLYWIRGLFEDPEELFQELGVERDDHILEVGCAIGYHTLPLARIAADGKVYAVDVWEEALAYLGCRIGAGENVETLCHSAEAVELPPASLHKVVCFDTLHEVPNPGLAVEKWTGFLREGGQFFYQDPEIPPERIPLLSKDKLRQAGVVRGIHVFVRQ